MSIDMEEFACGLLKLVEENRILREKVAHLEEFKKAYWEEIETNRKHGEFMIGGLLEICMVPGVIDAVRNRNDD